MTKLRLFPAVALAIGLLLSPLADFTARGQDGAGAVYVIEITGTIDLGLAPYLQRVLDEAEDDGAAAVLLVIDTPGGRLDAVLQMRDALLGSSVPTIAWVNRTAFSAGALVAIASERIYMTPGAVMGAATPVLGGTGEAADEKTISAVRATFATTAEVRGRDPRVAEAMVDPDLAVEGLVGEGDLLTLTTTQAVAWGYTDGVAATRAEVLAAEGLVGAPVVETSIGLAERAARFITDPVIASLLILLGILLIVGDFLVEGLGLPALAGAGLLVAFFWGHLLAGLAGWEDVALVALGLVLIAIELFVIPGFGVAGVLGLIALFGGLYLAVLSRDIRTPAQTERALWTVAIAFLGVIIGFVAILILLPRRRFGGGLVLQASMAGEAAASARPPGWLGWFGGNASLPTDHASRAQPVTARKSRAGLRGVALNDLRPSGTVEIAGARVDAVSEGGFIPEGSDIVVARDEGAWCVVRHARS